MQILPGDDPDETIIEPGFHACRLLIRGLNHRATRALLRGESSGREAWRPGVSIIAELADAPPEPEGAERVIELEDGRVHLLSGAPGRVEVGSTQSLGDTLLPRSLNLLLAQQWARVGLMMVHGAAFRFNSTGVLTLGRQGAGKSTLTAAALAAGGRVVSDDWLLLGVLPSGEIRAQRLRNFLMFRENPATQELLSAVPELVLSGAQQGRKLVAAIDRQPKCLADRFVESTRIDQIWLLEAATASRTAEPRLRGISQSELLAALTEATMPLLFSKRFPAERNALLHAATRAIQASDCKAIISGSMLISRPRQSVQAIVRSDSPKRWGAGYRSFDD